MSGYIVLIVALLAGASALPADPVIYKLDEDRFQYVPDAEGNLHLVDLWVKASDLRESARYNPDRQNVYHLFTRANPSQSQVLVFGTPSTVRNSNISARRRTAVIIHGWTNDATSTINTVLMPAFLAAEDMNVIVVDWNSGAGTSNYAVAVTNTVTSGESVARFINWLNSVTGASVSSYYITGHSLGGQQSGIVGRNLGGQVPHITSLDPALPGWVLNSNSFRATDGRYTEVIHTNAGQAGVVIPLGDVDFYPNGGRTMPGCQSQNCDHNRAFFYFGESLTSGGFTGRRCASHEAAQVGNCNSRETLNMGGVNSKTGRTGIYYLETNPNPPFSRG